MTTVCIISGRSVNKGGLACTVIMTLALTLSLPLTPFAFEEKHHYSFDRYNVNPMGRCKSAEAHIMIDEDDTTREVMTVSKS